MTHIDEGTIHAWLDDALAPDEAARVERHVRECAECASAVAEARGLIAASSRILSALDDVVGGVIPPKADDTPRDGGAAPLRLRLRRPWWQRPQFAAAAGIAFIAVAASVVARRGGVGRLADYSMERAPAVEAPQGAAPAATPAPAAAAESSAAAPGVAATQAATAEQDVAAEQKVAGAARAKVAAEREAPADPGSRDRAVAADAAEGGRRQPAAPTAAPPASAAAKAREAAAESRATVANPAPAPDSTSTQRKLAVSADAITRAEKARVLGESSLQLQAVVVTGAAAAAEARRDFTTASGIVGCYRLQRRVPALDAGVTEIVALDATGAGTFEGEALRVARLIGAAPEANTLWRWTLSARGDVALVRVQGEAYARFPLALRLAAQTGETSIATRIDCPAR